MLISIAQAQMFFLAVTRVLAILIHVPVLAGPLVPNQVKIGLGMLLAMVLIPWKLLPPEAPAMNMAAFGLGIGRELLIGTLAGFSATLAFGALQMAGEAMGMGSGFAAGKVLNPALEHSGSPLDQFFFMMTMLLFFILNGHHSFLLGIQRTFQVVPLNGPIPDLALDRLLRLTAEMIVAGIQMAFPVMGALLLADLAAGLLAKVAPQMQVFFLAIPIKVAVAIFGLMMTLGVLLPSFTRIFQAMGQQAVRLLGG